MQHWELLFLFGFIAFIYASVGFGGGSSYLAVLALYGMPVADMRLTALACNIVVVAGGTWLFVRRGVLVWRQVLPLVAASVPLAFAGAMVRMSDDVFFRLLGGTLILASLLLWLQPKVQETDKVMPTKRLYLINGAIGGGIGFLSGAVGIGGGIFLSPVLHLLRWGSARHIAAAASFFILVNSISGIAGQLATLPDSCNFVQIAMLCCAVLVGGQLGSRLGGSKLPPNGIRRLTAALVGIAGLEVLLKHV